MADYVLSCQEAAAQGGLPMPPGHEDGLPDCTCLVHEHDVANGVISTSHMHSDVPPEVRLNIDYPEVEDRRQGSPVKRTWKLAADEHLHHLGWSEEDRRRVAYLASAKEHHSPKGRGDGAAHATKCKTDDGKPINLAALKAEGARKKWGHDDPEVIAAKGKGF